MPGTAYRLEVHPRLPQRLARLEELASNLAYSWDRTTRALFARLDPPLWDAVGHSPKAMLKRVDEQRLIEAAADPVYLNSFNRVLSAYDSYQSEPLRVDGQHSLRQDDLVAYFCAEFGLHESLPIYSGGLGILAGDHCKAASDARLPFVAVGLLYRQGYFSQTIDAEGAQHAEYADADFDDLPIEPVNKSDGSELNIALDFPDRTVHLKVWRAKIGHVQLFLLDTALDQNSEHDRAIVHRLYGGDNTTRLEQELILGIGGARALAAIGVRPTVWHINEGHAAFLVLERVCGVMREGVDFDAALEAVAASTIFTTHTAVPAGHDVFSEALVAPYVKTLCRELEVDIERIASLARSAANINFNMTTLAVRGSRHHNGVSRIHGGLSARLLADLWPQIEPAENPFTYITNGVHVPTFLAPEWIEVFNRFLGFGWTHRLADARIWEQIRDIPDHIFWSVRQYLKAQMLYLVGHRIRLQHARNQGSEAHIDRLLRLASPADPTTLVIGFGRRFATYKRATLLFNDLGALAKIVGDPERPVLFVFSGKAHPADAPGQALIREITRVAKLPEFEGKILLVEGYDLRFARRLVCGVDVWLNNPVYPLEACGTSGMKAGMNGVINVSVIDGWWGEGYAGDNGWAIKPASAVLSPDRRDYEEARTLYEILQDQLIPLYYRRGGMGFSPEWIRMAKRSMATLLPRYNATRMVNEYVTQFYHPASKQGRRYSERAYEGAKVVAAWKARVRAAWPGVSLRRLDPPRERIRFGETMPVEVAVNLNGLAPEDVIVELLLARGLHREHDQERHHELMAADALADGSGHRFTLALKPELCGRLDYRIRVYPHHALLTHPLELGLMVWL